MEKLRGRILAYSQLIRCYEKEIVLGWFTKTAPLEWLMLSSTVIGDTN